MATGEAPDGKPAAAHRTVDLDGLGGVAGAAGMKATVIPEQGAQEVLVSSDQSDQQPAHS
jgi:hypothetical protein